MSRSSWQRDEEPPYGYVHNTGYHHDDLPVLGHTLIDPQLFPHVAQHLNSVQSPPPPTHAQPVYVHHDRAPPAQVHYHQRADYPLSPSHPHYVQPIETYAYQPSRYSPPEAVAAAPQAAPHPFAGAVMQSPMTTEFSGYSHGYERDPPSSRYAASYDADNVRGSRRSRQQRGESASAYGMDPRSSAPSLSSSSRISARRPTVTDLPPMPPASPPTPPPQTRRQSIHQIQSRPPLPHKSSSETYQLDLNKMNLSRPGSTSIENQPPRRRERGRSFTNNNRSSANYALYGDPRRSDTSFNSDPRRSEPMISNYDNRASLPYPADGVVYILPDSNRQREKSRHRKEPSDDAERRHRHKHRHHHSRKSSPSVDYDYERPGRRSRPSSPSPSAEVPLRSKSTRRRSSRSRVRPVSGALEYDYRPPSRGPVSTRMERAESRPPSRTQRTPTRPSTPVSSRGEYRPPTPTAARLERPERPERRAQSPERRPERRLPTPEKRPKTPPPAPSVESVPEPKRPSTPPSSTLNNRREVAGVQPGQVFIRPDLKCAMANIGLCAFDDPTDDHGHNKLLRLDCGHGFHHECLKSAIASKERISTSEVDLESADKLWCERCRNYFGKKAGQ